MQACIQFSFEPQRISDKAIERKPFFGLSVFLVQASNMQNVFVQYIFLILIILALVMLAARLRLASPIMLVLGGLALSFTSAFSDITINPDLMERFGAHV